MPRVKKKKHDRKAAVARTNIASRRAARKRANVLKKFGFT